MQPNEQTVAAMRDASRMNVQTQGNKPFGPLGILSIKDDNVEGKNTAELAAAGAASSNTAKQGAYAVGGAAAQPNQPQNQGPSRTGIQQGQTTATGLIAGAMQAGRRF